MFSEEQAEKVKEMLGKIKFRKFSVKLANVGVFDKKVIRIIWVALEAKELFELQKQIDENLKGLFDNEERFMAHITIARPKNVPDKKKLIDKLASLKLSGKDYAVDRVCFKKSELTNAGPVYENLLEIEGKQI